MIKKIHHTYQVPERQYFHDLLKKEKISGVTRVAYERQLRRFYSYFYDFCGYSPEEAKVEQIGKYISSCYPAYIRSTSTLSVHRSAISYWYRQTRGENLPTFEALPGVSREGALRYFDPSALENLLSEGRGHPCGLILRFIYFTGASLIETIPLLVGDFDFENWRVNFRNRKKCPVWNLPEEIKYDLYREKYSRSSEEPIFSLRKGVRGDSRPISRRMVNYYLAGLSDKQGIKSLNVQSLRDNFALGRLLEGMDSRLVMRMMGYSNIRSMCKYKKFVRELGFYENPTLSPDDARRLIGEEGQKNHKNPGPFLIQDRFQGSLPGPM